MKNPCRIVPAAAGLLWCCAVATHAQFPVTIAHAHPTFGYSEPLFTQYADFLVANDYHTVTPGQFYDWLVNQEPMPIRPILLTFDDNYIALYTSVYPVLKARGLMGVNFAHTNYVGVGGANDHADWTEIQEMETAATVFTESHTMNHVNLTQQTPTTLTTEVEGSKAAIESHLLNKTCNHIAYPYGAYNPAVIAACQTGGYQMGYTTNSNLNYHSTPVFEIGRRGIDGVTMDVFKDRIGFPLLPPPPPGPGWTIDNTDVNFFADLGAWSLSSATPGYYGTDYRQKPAGDGTKPARWAAYLPRDSQYRVYARWTDGPDRAPTAMYTVHYPGGTREVTVDQRTGGGQWVSLGTFPFTTQAPAQVLLSDSADGLLVADGVWFEPVTTAVEGWLLY